MACSHVWTLRTQIIITMDDVEVAVGPWIEELPAHLLAAIFGAALRLHQEVMREALVCGADKEALMALRRKDPRR